MERRLLNAATAGALVLAMTASPRAAEDELFRLLYDFEVAGYCSLVDERVGRGFHTRLATLLAERSLADGELDALRGRAWQAAHAEWQNRGLGGFRGWCHGEGRAAARRLGAHAPQQGG